MIKVSLIVPIYNTSKYLDKCINSLINQTLKDIEIILINDGSLDNSEEIIKKYKDKRIKYIKKENEGIGKTRNLGINTAKGKYIAFVDSDDYLELDFCEKMYEKAINDNCDLVICDYYKDFNDIKKEINYISFQDTNLKKYPKLINEINLGPCNKLYLLELLKNNNIFFVENLKYEDAPFVINALINSKNIGKVNKYLTNYVIHENSETTIRDERIFDILKITDMIAIDLKKANIPLENITDLVVMILTDYTIQQRYINNSNLRNKFINAAFNYLNSVNKKWRKCNYLKQFACYRRLIKSSKVLTKLYCLVYSKKIMLKRK